MKLLRKERVGSRIKKEYDKPITPYQRLLDSAEMNESQKHRLREAYKRLDPIDLQLNLESKLKEFYELVRKDKLKQELAA